MNAGELLIRAIHQVARAAELTIATGPAKKSDTDSLSYRPTLNPRPKSVDSPDCLVAGHARPFYWKLAFHCACIGMAHATGFNTNSHLCGAGISKRFAHEFQYARTGSLNRPIGRCAFHNSSPHSLMLAQP